MKLKLQRDKKKIKEKKNYGKVAKMLDLLEEEKIRVTNANEQLKKIQNAQNLQYLKDLN